MSSSSYYSGFSHHSCSADSCRLRTALTLNNFGRRFYGCSYYNVVSNSWFSYFFFPFLVFFFNFFIFCFCWFSGFVGFMNNFNLIFFCRMMNLLVNTLGGWMAKHVSVDPKLHPLSLQDSACTRIKQEL